MKFPFDIVYDATMALLPAGMRSVNAKAMLIAIGLQESRFEHRRQMGDGPARGFWQFEQAGIRGVLTHRATSAPIRLVIDALRYQDKHPVLECWNAVEHNDILAMAFARLNLWWIAGPIPGPGEHEKAWAYYIEGWRPGKPHIKTWAAFYAQAWQHVSSG